MVAEDETEYDGCQEAVRRLTEFLDHELRPDEEEMVKRHLLVCHGCFARFQFEETLLGTIRERLQAVRAPSDLHDRILRLISSPASDTTEQV